MCDVIHICRFPFHFTVELFFNTAYLNSLNLINFGRAVHCWERSAHCPPVTRSWAPARRTLQNSASRVLSSLEVIIKFFAHNHIKKCFLYIKNIILRNLIKPYLMFHKSLYNFMFFFMAMTIDQCIDISWSVWFFSSGLFIIEYRLTPLWGIIFIWLYTVYDSGNIWRDQTFLLSNLKWGLTFTIFHSWWWITCKNGTLH